MAADKLCGSAIVWPAAKECRLFLGKWEVRPKDILSLAVWDSCVTSFEPVKA
jgi:hypothetical protein